MPTPLFNSPYFSRFIKNTNNVQININVYEYYNMIYTCFGGGYSLQSQELNELQEQIANQMSLMNEFMGKWSIASDSDPLTFSNILPVATNNNIVGFINSGWYLFEYNNFHHFVLLPNISYPTQEYPEIYLKDNIKARNTTFTNSNWDILDDNNSDTLNENGNSRIQTFYNVEYIDPSPLLPATSILDYEVWATDWEYLGNLRYHITYNPNGYGSPNYTTIAIVPTVNIETNVYNGYREFHDTSGSNFVLETTVLEASNIPESRRVLQPYMFWDDLPVPSGIKANHYINNTTDGTTYLGARFQTIWHDAQYLDNKSALKGVLQQCKSAGIKFAYTTDNRGLEMVGRFYSLQGSHTYWNGNGAFDNQGNATSGNYGDPNVGGIRIPDARFFAANINDSRFTDYINPQTGKSVGHRMVEFYDALSGTSFNGTPAQLYEKAAGITRANDFTYYGGSTKHPFSYYDYGPGEALTPAVRQDEVYRAQAWIAAIDEFINGYYAVRMFTEAKNEVQYHEDMKYASYSMFPVSLSEAKYFRDSNDQPFIGPMFPNMAGGNGWYGWSGNIIYPYYEIPTLHSSNNNTHNYISGYVLNPTTDFEKYNWQGHQSPDYIPSVGATLIRYANNPLSGYPQWKLDLTHKQFINDLKLLRHMFISKPDYYKDHTPFIAQHELGGYSGNPTLGILNANRSLYHPTYDNARYFREFMYHTLLHGVLYVMNYGATRTTVQEILDTWRNISFNSKSRPCSNATGNIDLPVDRLLLWDAVTNVVMSGGKMLSTGKYLWRITAPPTAIRPDNTIVFNRIDNDSDIPPTVTIDCNILSNGRGMWVQRNISTPPKYMWTLL